MISASLRQSLSDPSHDLASLTDDVLRDALHQLDDEPDEGIVSTLVLLGWSRRLLSVKPALVRDVGEKGLEFVALMKDLQRAERERRLRLARAT